MKYAIIIASVLCCVVTVVAKDPVFYLKNKSDRYIRVDILSRNLTPTIFTAPFKVAPQESLLRSDIEGSRVGGVKITYCNADNIDCPAWQIEVQSSCTFKFGTDDIEKFYVKFSVDQDNGASLEPQKGNLLGRTEDWSYSLNGNVKKITLTENNNTKRLNKNATEQKKPALLKSEVSKTEPVQWKSANVATVPGGEGRVTLESLFKYHNMNDRERRIISAQDEEYYKTHIFFFSESLLSEYVKKAPSDAVWDALKKKNIVDQSLMMMAQDILKDTGRISGRIKQILEDSLNTYINGSEKEKENFLRNYTFEKMFFLVKLCDPKSEDKKIEEILSLYLSCCIPLTDYLKKIRVNVTELQGTTGKMIRGVLIENMVGLLLLKLDLDVEY